MFHYSTVCVSLTGWLKQQDICGIKWVSGYPENMKHKVPSIVGTLILNSPETGVLVCIIYVYVC